MPHLDQVADRVRPANDSPANNPAAGATMQGDRLERLLLLVCLPAISMLMALPWLIESWVWSGWLAIALALGVNHRLLSRERQFSRRFGARSLVYNWTWSTLALAIAFYWSPAALAYSMASSYKVGLAIAVPILIWDATKLALPFWLGVRLAPSLQWSWLSVSCLAVLVESYFPGVFAWRLGYLQSEWIWTYQAADLLGPSLGTVTVFAHGGLLFLLATSLFARLHSKLPGTDTRWMLPRLSHGLVAVILCCLINLTYSLAVLSSWKRWLQSAPSTRVALLQVDPTYIDGLGKIQQLTNKISKDVDLVFWPESTAGCYEANLTDLSTWESVFPSSREPSRGLQPWPTPTCPLIVGGKTYTGDLEEPDQLFISALLIDERQQLVDRYHKRYLMPFGEFVPGADVFPSLHELFPMSEDVTASNDAHILCPTPTVRLGVMLCYEDMVPGAVTSLVKNKANLLVCLINGSAFESATTLLQHRKLAQFRAVEARRTFLRSAATGETCIVSPLGVITERLPLHVEAAITAEVPIVDYLTWHCRLPWLLPVVTAFVLVGLTICKSISYRRSATAG
ncbi:MAG: apolipoprotein N-acyltransferase [Pirellulaceae bacterium]